MHCPPVPSASGTAAAFPLFTVSHAWAKPSVHVTSWDSQPGRGRPAALAAGAGASHGARRPRGLAARGAILVALHTRREAEAPAACSSLCGQSVSSDARARCCSIPTREECECRCYGLPVDITVTAAQRQHCRERGLSRPSGGRSSLRGRGAEGHADEQQQQQKWQEQEADPGRHASDCIWCTPL